MDVREIIAHQWARYERMNDREQLLIIATLILFILAFFVFLVWEPLHNARDDSKQRFYEELELQQELKALQPVRGTRAAADAAGSSDQSLLAVVNKSTAESGINLKRVEPKDERSLRVWVDGVEFNKLITWIASLQSNHNVKVDTISLDRIDNAGFVNTALVLTR